MTLEDFKTLQDYLLMSIYLEVTHFGSEQRSLFTTNLLVARLL